MEHGERRMLLGFLGTVAGVSVLLLALFAAWGRITDRPPPPGAKRIVFMGWGGVIERKVFSDLIAEFKRRNPDIDVEYRPVPRDFVTNSCYAGDQFTLRKLGVHRGRIALWTEKSLSFTQTT